MLPYLRVKNVYEARIDLSDVMHMNFSADEAERFRLVEGDVLLNEGQSLEWVGRPAVYRDDLPGACFTNTLVRFQAHVGVTPDYACFLFRYYMHVGVFQSVARWTTNIAHLGAGRLADLPFLLPSTGEQKRIVIELDSYFTRLDDAVVTLERVQANLKRYRASVLKVAVEGRLVPTEAELARAEGRSYEPASVLLERILKERRRRWEDAELASMVAKGKPPKDDKWKAKYKEPAPPDTAGLPELPEGWCWATLDQMAWLVRNGYSIAPHEESGVRILRISAVRPLRINFEDARYLPPPVEQYERDLLCEGDLVFTRYNGSPSLVGVCGLVRQLDQPTVHPDKLIKVRLTDSVRERRFIELAANTGESRRHVEVRTRTTAGQAGISGGDLRQMPVPLCPSREQSRVADEADRLLTLARETAELSSTASSRAVRLRQSILKWAFEGKLVDQDPSDEPASILLERIKTERDAAAAKAKPKKRAKRKKKVTK